MTGLVSPLDEVQKPEPDVVDTGPLSDAPDDSRVDDADVMPPPVSHLPEIRALLLKAHPDVVPELIGGDSIAALLASVEPARDAYARLAETIRGDGGNPAMTPTVPAGGGGPLPVDPDRLPPAEKIRRGIAGRRS